MAERENRRVGEDEMSVSGQGGGSRAVPSEQPGRPRGSGCAPAGDDCRTRNLPTGQWQEPRQGGQGQAAAAPGATGGDRELAARGRDRRGARHAAGRVEDAGCMFAVAVLAGMYGAYLASNGEAREALQA